MAKGRSLNDMKKDRTRSHILAINYLSESCIYLHQEFPEKLKLTVPPTSPKQILYDYSLRLLPDVFPKLADLDLPYVREVGIKASIKQLAKYFQCSDYKFNLIQFWFLDIITDCLWRAQDEFQFPDEHQKIILEWILYIFNLIRAPHLNLTRKKLFKLFKEAMLIAEDYIESGCSAIPLPEELFAVNLEHEDIKEESYTTLNSEGSLASTDSTMSTHSSSIASSYIAIKFEKKTELYKVPVKPCTWISSDDECLSTSIETASEQEKPTVVETVDDANTPEEEVTSSDDDMEFYTEPDLKKIPPRFLPSRESLGDTISISVETETIEEFPDDGKDSEWVDIPNRPPKPSCPHLIPHDGEGGSDKGDDDEVLHAWFDYYIWQQRNHDMNNSRKGWVPQIQEKEEIKSFNDLLSEVTEKSEAEKNEWMNYIREKQEDIRRVEKNIFINSCVLLAIKQFVFDYFYDTFPFTLLKIALRCPHSLITQEVNDKWFVPKLIKSDLKKPKPKKPKKEKAPKVKKEKKEKPKKPKKPPKAEKKSKAKASTASKKEKPKQLTKEEKAELARLKREEELLEEEKLKEEENKFFMFPLAEAATDDFFKSIFENWVKNEKGKKK